MILIQKIERNNVMRMYTKSWKWMRLLPSLSLRRAHIKYTLHGECCDSLKSQTFYMFILGEASQHEVVSSLTENT